MFTRLLKLDLQFFSADGSTGGGGYMVSPEHLQNVFQSPEPEPNPSQTEPEIEHQVDSVEPTEGQEPTQQEIQDLIDLGEGFGQLSLEDIRKGFLRQQDYTRKTQELAEQRKQFDEFKPVQEIFQLIEQDPRLQDQFATMLQNYFYGGQGEQGTPQQQPQQPQFDPRYHELQQKLSEQDQFIKQWQEQQAVEKATQEWNALAAKFPDAKDMQEQIYQFAIDNQVNLDMAYRYLNYDKVAQKTQEQMVANQRKKQVARTTAPSNPSGATPQASQKPKSYSDVLRLLKEEGINLTD